MEYIDTTINHKQTIIKLKKIAGQERKAVTLEIHPAFPKPFLEKANNLGKLVDWWKEELDDWPGVKLKVQNLKVKKNKATNSIIVTYDCPANTKDAIIHNENAYFAQPNADDTHPIYYDDNDKILSGKHIDEELVSAARIEKEDTVIKTKKVRGSKKRKGSGTRRRR
jgi:hypothetical protein